MYLSLQYRIKFQTLIGVFSCERLNSSIFYFMKTRVCVRCKLEKPLSEFYRSKDYKYHYDCKECSKKQMAELHRKKIKIIPIIDLFEENDGETIYEKWVPIKGYEVLYEISSFGRIKSLARKHVAQDKIIKLQNSAYGYYIVSLHDKCGVMTTYLVHILVAKHFIKNPKNKPEVNHKKGIKKDNRYHQLEWSTKLENVQHAFETGLVCHKGQKNANHILTNEQVLEIFNSELTTKELSKKYKVKTGAITQIKRGNRWSHLTGKKYIKREMLSVDNVKYIINNKLTPTEAAYMFNVPEHRIYKLKKRVKFKHLFE